MTSVQERLAQFRANQQRRSERATEETDVDSRFLPIVESSDVARCLLEGKPSDKWSKFKINIYIVKILIWLLVYCGFIILGFGAVYFVTSLLVILWRSMKTENRLEGQPSAYSVFNPGCESIDGTLKAEQFEQELRFGPGSVK